MIIYLSGRVEVARMPGGVVGSISFGQLIKHLRKAGELREDETITHLKIDVSRGTIEYLVENRE
jgi:hypothetical protein